MADQDATKTQRVAADRTAETGAKATRQGAEKLQDQMNSMLGTAGRASQEAARRTSENLELMKRLAETMASGAKEASSELVAWTRRASERQTEATREIGQARSLDEVLEFQDRYIRENLQALLDLSAKVARLSAETASEASSRIDPGRR